MEKSYLTDVGEEMSWTNPYKRVEELKEKLVPLEYEEKHSTGKPLKNVQDKIFWIVLELLTIENTIKFFELKEKKLGEKLI